MAAVLAVLACSALVPAASASAAVNPRVSTPVAGVNSLDSIGCPTARACVSVGADSSLNGKSAVITTATGAVKAWSGALASDPLNAVACPAKATTCLTVADDAVATVKVSGGAMAVTAKPKAPAGGIVAMGAIACESAKNCYAVGFQGIPGSSSAAIVVHLSGAGKLLSKTAEPGTGMAAIACPASTRCLVGGYNAPQESLYLLNSGRLGPSHAFPAHTYVQAISCYKASLCYALGGNSSASPSTTNELFPLNPTTGAIGTMATMATLNGTSLTCISATICLVAGFTGSGSTGKPGVVVVTRGAPGAAKNYPGSAFSGIGCASASHCYGVGVSTSGAIVDKVSS